MKATFPTAFVVLALALCSAGSSLGQKNIGRAAGESAVRPSASSSTSRGEFTTVQLILGELADQLRIASAKLRRQSLDRKRQMGRLGTLLDEADERVKLAAAELRRLEERHRQLTNELSVQGDAAHELLAQSRAVVERARAHFRKLARERAELHQQLVELQAQHLHSLLKAAILAHPWATEGSNAESRSEPAADGQ